MIEEKQLIDNSDSQIELKESKTYKNYYADRAGNVYHMSTRGLNSIKPEVINAGYLVVQLAEYGKATTVQRIVASCWLPNPGRLSDVDHIDDDRTNNRVSNLRWISHRDNLVKRHRLDSMSQKQTIAIAITGDETITFSSVSSAARHFDVSFTTLSGWVRDGKQHRGYSFYNSNSINN